MKRLLFLILVAVTGISFSQAQEVRGTVTDSRTGNPLSGVSVTVKGTNVGTTTDQQGLYRINATSANVLVFTYTGMALMEQAVGDKTEINVSLNPSNESLQEVVVVAYGNQNRRRITGAVGKLPGSEVENVPLVSVDQMLQGKIAGLQSVATSGQPGSAQQIRIRGIGSITASSAPLFVIDGIPVNTGDASSLTNSSNLLASLNPNDIETISVLKDASAASIYGSRAANGVIIINTKKGRAGKTKIRVDAEFGKSDIAYIPELGKPLNRDEVNELFREGLGNAGYPDPTIDFIMENFFWL